MGADASFGGFRRLRRIETFDFFVMDITEPD
jgi:hypothetical protein